MPKTSEEMVNSMIANLQEKTGKGLDDWLRVARARLPARHGEIVQHLKSEHGIGHGYANLIAQYALSSQASGELPGGDDLVEAQYAGAKAALRPIYEAIVKAVAPFGKDVEIAPKKTYVSLRRNRQFGLIQPTTATRVDVGINLKGKAPTPRLEASGSFNSMVSHRVRVGEKKEVDAELLAWLREAYEAS